VNNRENNRVNNRVNNRENNRVNNRENNRVNNSENTRVNNSENTDGERGREGERERDTGHNIFSFETLALMNMFTVFLYIFLKLSNLTSFSRVSTHAFFNFPNRFSRSYAVVPRPLLYTLSM
jgi:hypothetical protein